ncbi:MAG TPA: hypothetical protein VGK73_22910 [Polyangiaceae bacterium]
MPASPPAMVLHEEAPAQPGEGEARRFQCDACGEWFEGEPGGAGLFLWTRGEEVRYEEPPLCEGCAAEISVGALVKWDTEEEEEG